jgi:hypothetical protein
MGWRGKNGDEHLRGEPNPKQWEAYEQNNCVFQYHMPRSMHFMRNWNRRVLGLCQRQRLAAKERSGATAPFTSDTLQAFRLAAQGKSAGRQPPEHLRERIDTYFDPLPFWYAPLEDAATDLGSLPAATPSRSARWPCTTPGTRKTPGCGRSTATTTST